MARKRVQSRKCALCEKVLYGFDDDLDLGALLETAGEDLSRFAGQAMCGGCFESWPQRALYGEARVAYILKRLESTTRTEIYNDPNSVLLLEIGVRPISWKPVKLENKEEHTAILWLKNTGTEVRIPLQMWSTEMPTKRGEKRLRPCELEAMRIVWSTISDRYQSVSDLMNGIDEEAIIERHRVWLEREQNQ